MFKYGVYSFNGANGEEGTTMVKSFDKKEDAKKCAQGYNAVLTRDEKRFFEMKYKVRIFRVGETIDINLI
jgi:hypothetical protein